MKPISATLNNFWLQWAAFLVRHTRSGHVETLNKHLASRGIDFSAEVYMTMQLYSMFIVGTLALAISLLLPLDTFDIGSGTFGFAVAIAGVCFGLALPALWVRAHPAKGLPI